MFIGNYTKYLPFWKYHENKSEITYREFFDIKIKNYLENKTEKILDLKKISFVKAHFKIDFLKMFIKFILIKNDYIDISDKYILNKFKRKKKIINIIYLQNLVSNLKYIIKSFILALKFLFNQNKEKILDKNKEYDILVQFFHGGKNDKLDFPDEDFLKKNNFKVLTLMDHEFKSRFSQRQTQKQINEDFICTNRLEIKKNRNIFKLFKPSDKNKKIIKHLLKIFIYHPYYVSILVNYILIYEFYYQLFSKYNIKVFVHGKTMDSEIAPIRNVCDNLNILNINYSRSYLPSRFNDVLSQPDELVFCWGYKMSCNYDKRINKIKYIVNASPYFSKLNKKNLEKNNHGKTISIFDSSFDIDTAFSTEKYLNAFKFITKLIYENQDFNLIIKHKWQSLGKRIFNQKYLNLLKNENRVTIFDKSYSNNNNIIQNSDLVVCFGSFSVGTESLFSEIDSISLLANSYKNHLIDNLNNIYPIASKDEEIFKNMFMEKIKFNNNRAKIKKLKDFFFDKTNFRESNKLLLDYLIKIKKSRQRNKSLILREILND